MSIIGKVTVIKTLALPKFVYLLTVMPNPDQKIKNRTDQVFLKFLSEGKVRIARSFLEKDFSEGGLKLTNVPLFNYALKLTWVKRVIQTKGN